MVCIFPLTLFFSFSFLRPHLWYMEVPRLGVELRLQLPAYATARTTLDPSLICNLRWSLWQHQMLNPLSKARDWTCILMETRQVRFEWATMGTPKRFSLWWDLLEFTLLQLSHIMYNSVHYICHVVPYIPSTYLSYNWEFVPFIHFLLCSPCSGLQIRSLLLWVCFWSTTDLNATLC